MTGLDLAAGVAVLGRSLRERGVAVGIGDEADAARALARVPGADREETRRALRIALKLRPGEWGALDALLDAHWPADPPEVNPATRAPTASIDGRRPGRAAPQPRELALRADAGADAGVGPAGGDLPGWSPEPLLRSRPFDACSEDDLAAMERVLARLAARLATRRSRRLAPTRGRGVPDPRRSLRRALSTGGEVLSFARRARKVEAPRLVVLCDTSGSMETHARFLLAFVLSLRRVARRTEVFAFNTALVRLTPLLAPGAASPRGPGQVPALPSPREAGLGRGGGRIVETLARVAAEVPDWAGGTRIGDSLAHFVDAHLAALVDGRTVVVILSDGLDRGEPERLAGAMRAIRARAGKVIWLNPLLGDPRYEPTARGMQAALPFVDAFLPAHDLASLERLVPHLKKT